MSKRSAAVAKSEQPDVEAMVAAALAKTLGPLADVIKDMTISDTHQPTALGNEEDKGEKKKTFLSTIADAKAEADTGDVGKSAEWGIPFQIAKADADERLVFGWASISTRGGKDVVDKQGDIVPADELEKAAYDFVLYSRAQGEMHVRKGTGRLVESMVFTKQKQDLLGIDLGLEGWWVGFRVDDDSVWKNIKDGSYPEFSIGGRGKRAPVE